MLSDDVLSEIEDGGIRVAYLNLLDGSWRASPVTYHYEIKPGILFLVEPGLHFCWLTDRKDGRVGIVKVNFDHGTG